MTDPLKRTVRSFPSPSPALQIKVDRTLDRIRSRAIAASEARKNSSSRVPSRVPPTFLTIAGELRNQIYSLLLLEEAILYPYDNKPCSPDCPKHHRHNPNVAILAVNKQINAEATPILYSNATFRITTGQNLMRFLNKGDHLCLFQTPTPDSTYPSRHFIRHLQIKFVPEHTPAELRDQRNVDLWGDEDFRAKTTSEKAQLLHNYDKDLSDLVWRNGGIAIPRLQGLTDLTINIELCFCPIGCCRMTANVINALDGLKTTKGIKLIVNGCLLPGEEQTVRKALKCELDTKPMKPERDRVRDAQRIRDVFEGLYSSSESGLEVDSLDDEDDSDEDDDEVGIDDEENSEDDEDDSEDDEEDSDHDGDEDGSSESESSGDVDGHVPVAKAEVETLETSFSVTDAGSQSQTTMETVDVDPHNGPGNTTDKTVSLRVLTSDDARRLMVTVNPTASASNSSKGAAAQSHNDGRGGGLRKEAERAFLKSLRASGPNVPSLVVPSIWPQPVRADSANVSSNHGSNTEEFVSLRELNDLYELK